MRSCRTGAEQTSAGSSRNRLSRFRHYGLLEADPALRASAARREAPPGFTGSRKVVRLFSNQRSGTWYFATQSLTVVQSMFAKNASMYEARSVW